jgi:hypothetical protein
MMKVHRPSASGPDITEDHMDVCGIRERAAHHQFGPAACDSLTDLEAHVRQLCLLEVPVWAVAGDPT